MFYYSKLSHRKIVHLKKCYIAKRIRPETTGTFKTAKDAFDAGYRLCRCCNPVAKQYRKEEAALIDHCRRNGMLFRYSDRSFKITSMLGKWIIQVTPNGKTTLYHKNTREAGNNAETEVDGFHKQKISYDTLIEYFDYISNHDRYRARHPEPVPKKKHAVKLPPRKGTKRWRAAQQKIKNHERRRAIRNVLDIIDSLDSTYSTAF